MLEPIPLEFPRAWGGAVGRGRIRVEIDDFSVKEVPLQRPTGAGEHCWLYVRKRDSNTEWVARQLARFAGVALSAVSYAGLKDRRAITEQWFSVHLPGKNTPNWYELGQESFQILESGRHQRKLQRGTLRGNRFCIRVRDVDADRERLEKRLEQLRQGGFPNYFGPQRFGHQGSNLEQAADFIAGYRRVSRHKRSLYLSAVRSALFNRVLAARVLDQCWNSGLPGEAFQLEGKSACFVAPEIDEPLRQRLRSMQIHPTGPLCGEGKSLSTGQALAYEEDQLQRFRTWIEALRRSRLTAARRALRVVVHELTWQSAANGDWILQFYLPAGSYATSFLHEIFELEQPG